MIKVDIRSKNSAYITIGKWVIYVDNSTGEQLIDSWEENENYNDPGNRGVDHVYS
jgi:ribosomal protein L35AE/L33A